MAVNSRFLLAVLPLLLSSCGVFNVLSGCRTGYVSPDFAALQRDLSAARTRWQAAGIPSYRYDFLQFATPVVFPALRVTVQNGQVTRTEAVQPSAALPTPAGKTVDELFAELATRLAASRTQSCRVLAFRFSSEDGHPLQLVSGTAKRGVVDGAGGWEISHLTRL